jgi:transposase
MDILYPKCAGLDIHKDTIVACVRLAVPKQKALQEVRTFGTTTAEILALSDWLTEKQCSHVAMEATGVYWKPIWHLLQGAFLLVLANPKHIRNVPGRKSDVNDAIWIADLLAHGLIEASFVPPTEIQDVRTVTRTRQQLVWERTQHLQRLQKTLEDANIKVASQISDLLGVSGRAILKGLIAGETDPATLLSLTQGRLKARREDLLEALRGNVREIHRSMLQLHLSLIETLDKRIGELEAQASQMLAAFQEDIDRLIQIPGISLLAAYVILAEIGPDRSKFPSAGNLLSWGGYCPRQDESAGKHRSTKIREGDPWLKPVMIQAAWAAVRTKDSYYRAQFARLKSRRGPKKAIVAVAASMMTAIYHILRDKVAYQDLGIDYFVQKNPLKKVNQLVNQLKRLGVQVEVRPAA